MRKELKNEIDNVRQQLAIPNSNFRPLPFTTDWHKLEEQIYQRFCKITGKSRPIWLWERFKHNYYGLSLNIDIHLILNQLVSTTETIWFMVSDDSNFLFYEGKVEAIQSIVGETSYELDEYYLISKKYEWLFCVNHHDFLIGTGDFAIQQLNAFAQRFPELLTPAYPA